jgi:L-ascorbate metabolism protein UlaG (beta-lactamase superfamily)
MSQELTLNNLKITWLGHASFLISKFHSDTQIPLRGTEIRTIYIDPYNISEGPKADLILCTHSHFDHYDEKSIQLLSKKETEVLVGGQNIKEDEEKELEGIKIKAVPAYNLKKPFHPRGQGVGFVIEIAGYKIYHAGDTDAVPEMAELKNQIDLALLPIGGTYTMDVNEAVEAVKMIKPKIVIPMHYGTLKETKANPEEFKKLVGNLAEVKILE